MFLSLFSPLIICNGCIKVVSSSLTTHPWVQVQVLSVEGREGKGEGWLVHLFDFHAHCLATYAPPVNGKHGKGARGGEDRRKLTMRIPACLSFPQNYVPFE